MYRLLIADDEALEREGLEWIVQRMMPDTFEIIHAENGRAAIERAEEYRPHIIFMDVNMPGIQGLAALREIKQHLPDTKLVLVTAYDYFAYAKEALTLGVKEYIVKPASREQIVQTLTQLVDELEQEKRKRQDELELRHKVGALLPLVENELALMLMVDHVLGTEAEALAEWIAYPLHDKGCAIVVALPEPIEPRESRKLYDSIRSFAKTLGRSCIVSSFIERHMTLFLHASPSHSVLAERAELERFGEQLASMALRQLGTAVSVGIGTLRSGESGLRQSYYEAVFASTLTTAGGAVCLFDELKHSRPASEVSTAERPQEAGRMTAPGRHNEERVYVLSALQRIREEREQQTMTVLERAQQYIRERFTEELSLEEVADFVHLNAHYFSKVFKQQVGETFIDYVTGLRIEKAKALIASEQLSLKEVCFEVGYRDPNYFSRVFKKVTGVTPSEFRQGAVPPG